MGQKCSVRPNFTTGAACWTSQGGVKHARFMSQGCDWLLPSTLVLPHDRSGSEAEVGRRATGVRFACESGRGGV